MMLRIVTLADNVLEDGRLGHKSKIAGEGEDENEGGYRHDSAPGVRRFALPWISGSSWSLWLEKPRGLFSVCLHAVAPALNGRGRWSNRPYTATVLKFIFAT